MVIEMEPTPEQQKIISHCVSAKVLVTAGAGTGKTETLVRRIAKLVDDGLSPGSEVLVLTFTRAASGELKKRVASIGGKTSMVRARTLDSFATRLLANKDQGGAWTDLDYDERINYLTETISDETRNESVNEFGQGIKHLFVDEIQDLVGPRANMIRAVLESWDCGFTLLGDPAQGIFNFQLTGKDREIGSQAFYQWLRNRFGETLNEHTLSQNYRARTPEAKAALWAGTELNAKSPEYPTIHELLSNQATDLPTSGLEILRKARGTFAILSYTNCEAELISDNLAEKGIAHSVKPRSGANGISAWLGAALRTYGQGPIRQRDFDSRIESISDSRIVTPSDLEEAWMHLRRLSSGNQVEVRQLQRRIREFSVQDELFDDTYNQLIVSTIHRAKGLEFDNVILIPPWHVDDNLAQAEAARVLFVGMSRHRDRIFKLDPETIDTRNWSKRGGLAGDRWLRRSNYRGRKSQSGWDATMTGVEIKGNDIDGDKPASADIANGMNASAIQEFLIREVEIGDLLDLEFDHNPGSSVVENAYLVRHLRSNVILGRTGRVLEKDLVRPLMKYSSIVRKDVVWPEKITGARVQSIDTVASSTDALFPDDWVGESRIWNRVRMHGLATVWY